FSELDGRAKCHDNADMRKGFFRICEMKSREPVLGSFWGQQNLAPIICHDIIQPDQSMPGLSACLGFSLYRFAANFERLAVDTSKAAITIVSKAPATRIAMFIKSQQLATDCLLNRLPTNLELYCQLISNTHLSWRSFAKAASLSVSVKPYTPQSSDFG